MVTKTEATKLLEVGSRIREMREISGFSLGDMARRTGVSEADYVRYENGEYDFPFSFLHKCALAFGIEITDILEGHSPNLTSYTVTRKGQGLLTADEDGIEIKELAPLFKNKLAEPYWVRYEYSERLQNQPIHCTTHPGQEFDLVLSGHLKVQVGDHVEVLHEGDTILYNSATPHGMIAVDGEDCIFCAVVLPGEEPVKAADMRQSLVAARQTAGLLADDYVDVVEDENGALQKLSFKGADHFNFAFDVVDRLGKSKPDKLAMLHLSADKAERRFTFQDMSKESARAANYFKSLGVKKGDRVIVVLKRHYQFWFTVLALHKLGAVAIPSTNLLQAHDFKYRFQTAGVSAIICTADGDTAHQADLAAESCPSLTVKVMVGAVRDGWHSFDEEYKMFSSNFPRPEDAACGDDPSLALFTSGTTGNPKIALHGCKYPLGHYITAKYWHQVNPNGVHFTISDTGWGKALWGKLYGQWLCESAVFTYDFNRFDAADILPLFAKYQLTTFCAPPTMYRMMIREDLSKYDLSSLEHATTAGEALNPEVFRQFEQSTGLKIHEGFGQTETTLSIANLIGSPNKVGAMGKPTPLYDMDLISPEGESVEVGKTGEIVIRYGDEKPCGLYQGYYLDEKATGYAFRGGVYHTGDLAWRDEDGYYWYVGRSDDVIKSSGYRIGPFEIESIIMELPYVLECGVNGVPDELRGQIVKASVVLTKGTEPTEALKKEIQEYVKAHTAPYKYPRIVVFRDELPKTISSKIQRHLL